MKSIPKWTRFESSLQSDRVYELPVQQAQLEAEFRHESGAVHQVDGFWDGEQTWRLRFSPDLEGRWTWQTRSNDAALHAQSGAFDCVTYEGNNALYRCGAVRVAASGRHLEHADGSPFLWLGDTVWNGPLKATPREWRFFLRERAAKRFNVIQFVPTQWVAGAGNADLRLAYNGTDKIRIDPSFYQWLDERVDAINEFGMLAAPAMIWSAPSSPWVRLNPGNTLPDDQIAVLARYLVARYGAHHVAWMLGGDGDYRGSGADRWKQIGRDVFARGRRLVTMHPMGAIWVGREFEGESWFGFHGYQSGHWGSDEALRWITAGPPSTEWQEGSARPVINLEPCYEMHRDMSTPEAAGKRFDAYAVRRACYLSLLASPTAGVTYGAHGLWGWELKRQRPMNHAGTGVAPTWREAMVLPGSAHMTVLRGFFESVSWWTLLPAPEMLAVQPGDKDARRFISAARSAQTGSAVFYLPEGGTLQLRPGTAREFRGGAWVDPRTGEETPLAQVHDTLIAPTTDDWLLRLTG